MVADLELPGFGERSGTEEPKDKEQDRVTHKPHHGGGESKGEAGDEASPFILGESLPVVPAKLVKKILKGDFVDMADLLKGSREASLLLGAGGWPPVVWSSTLL